MATAKESEDAVLRLSPAQLNAFRQWFAEFDAAAWDDQIADDIASGHLDDLANEAVDDLRDDRCLNR